MLDLAAIRETTQADLLVAFYDLTGFRRAQQKSDDRELFDLMSELAELVGDTVEGASGVVVKFIGDAALIAFPAERADEAVRALLGMKREADEFLSGRELPCRMVVKAHVGPVVAGPLGTRSTKRLDVYGRTVSQAALLESKGFSMTPDTFRRLSPEMRKLFKKHTPPVRYIPVEERHRD